MQETKDGEIIQVTIIKNAQISVTITTTITDINSIPRKKQTKQWTQKLRDSKITLTQESDHYVPAQFSSDFFKKFDLAIKPKWDELKEQRGNSRQVNENTENNFIQAFGLTEDQMDKAAAILDRKESTKKSGNSSA